MAKKQGKAKTPITDNVMDWAEDLGRLLGTAETKAKGWIDQRKAVSQQLEGIRDTASRLLEQISGSSVAALALIPRKGRPPGRANATASPTPTSPRTPARAMARKGGMSPEGRARVAEAQRARWAKLREEAARKGAQVRAGVKKSKGTKKATQP